MKIKAPGLKTDMKIENLDIVDNRVVITGRIGAYNSTASAEPAEVRLMLASFFRPQTFFRLIKLLFAS